MSKQNYTLGTVAASEQLITDLYIELKRKVNLWASITFQTAQARMGYVGQHLVSVVTGFPGGRSGARGKDLILPNGEFAEIKTCYRVDQLGKCNECGAATASIETECPKCGSTDLKRNDDSKWLIAIKHNDDFASILDPRYYYLVLFEFTDLAKPHTIQASIWQVETSAPGFAYCMIDYYKNIQTKSASKAPFNFWPYQLKFDVMRPYLIYRSLITIDDKIQTLIFPGRDQPKLHPLKSLTEYGQSLNLTIEKIVSFAQSMNFDVAATSTKRILLQTIQDSIEKTRPNQITTADTLARALYLSDIAQHSGSLPANLLKRIGGRLG